MTFLGIADTAAAVPQVVLPRVEPDIVEGLWQRVVDGLWQEEGDDGADHGQEEGEEQQVVLAPAPAKSSRYNNSADIETNQIFYETSNLRHKIIDLFYLLVQFIYGKRVALVIASQVSKLDFFRFTKTTGIFVLFYKGLATELRAV